MKLKNMSTFNYVDGNGNLRIPKMIGQAVFVILVLSIVFGSMGTVDARERGVRTRFNRVVGIIQPGLYFKVPFMEKVIKMDVKTQTINYDRNGAEGDSLESSQLFGASKDLQDVKIGVVVNYHVDPEKVVDIFTQYNSVANYSENVLEPIVRETVKSISAQYTAEELVTKRAEYSDKVNNSLIEKFTTKSAIMEKFNITNFEFSRAFSDAIESKVTAVQNAEAQKNKLEQVKYEAQQTIEKAKADAEAIKIQAQAVNSQGGADYVALQAIKQWDGHYPTTVMGGSTIPLIQLK
ncbi:MAG: prohibitin family protein [Bacilli bacterium]|jgi:regulator of protease activity HflC (stomatin/prohibitin superfamily)